MQEAHATASFSRTQIVSEIRLASRRLVIADGHLKIDIAARPRLAIDPLYRVHVDIVRTRFQSRQAGVALPLRIRLAKRSRGQCGVVLHPRAQPAISYHCRYGTPSLKSLVDPSICSITTKRPTSPRDSSAQCELIPPSSIGGPCNHQGSVLDS
jgi:hypothetical protein